MIPLTRCGVMMFMLLCLAATGCRSTPPGEAVPQTLGLSDAQVLAVLAERAERVQRVMASGTLRLDSESEGSVRLEVALLASGDDRLRLRAWKLGQPVFDLTRDGQAVWLWASDRASGDGPPAERYPITADHLDTGWRLLTGRLFTQSPDRVVSRVPLVVEYDLENPRAAGVATRARLTINRMNQTLTRCEVIDPDGRVRQTLAPERYRLINGIPWSTRVVSSTPGSSFRLTFDDVELNGGLPASAFAPPRNAQRQP